jgi:hypothetical protein
MEIKKKAVLLLLIALAGFNILFLVTGRTGQIAFLCMLSLILLMWNWRRGLAILDGCFFDTGGDYSAIFPFV